MGGIGDGYTGLEKGNDAPGVFKSEQGSENALRDALLDEQSALDYEESRGEAKGKAARDKEIAINMLLKGLSFLRLRAASLKVDE